MDTQKSILSINIHQMAEQENTLGGGNFTVNPKFLLQDISIDFFDFQFIMNADWTMKECRHWETVLEPAIGSSLFLVKEKYFKKIKQHKMDKKKLEAHKEEKARMLEAWKNKEHHYQWHIRYCEKACGDKSRLLKAIWMIAHNVEKVNDL